MTYHNNLIDRAIQEKESFIEVEHESCNPMYILKNENLTLIGTLKRLQYIKPGIKIGIVDTVEDETNKKYILVLSMIKHERIQCTLIEKETKKITHVKYSKNPVMEYLLNRCYQNRTIH